MMKQNRSRRQFLKGLFSSLGAVIVAQIEGIFPEALALSNTSTRTIQYHEAESQRGSWESYNGFLLLPLLPEDMPMPSFVTCAPAPMLHGLEKGHHLAGQTTRFNSIDDLTNHIPFPTYIPSSLPNNTYFSGASILRFAQSGDIFKASIFFGVNGTKRSLISVWAQPIFPRPYPVWPTAQPSLSNKELLYPKKTHLLPSPGVVKPSALGHVFQWIKKDILYTLVVEHDPGWEEAIEIATSLVEV